MVLSGKARLAGVMGWPVTHSLSPRLHGHWLARHDIDGVFVPLAVRPENLETALRALPVLGFAGCNLTIPHKEAALGLMDELSPRAQAIGAVNTVTVMNDGKLSGDNTDGIGFIENLRAGHAAWRAETGPAVILGAGGAARAVASALLEAGAPSLRIFNRTHDRARELAGFLGQRAWPHRWDELPAGLEDAALVVNTTSLGMRGQPPLGLDLGPLPKTALVTDIVYVPLETELLEAARVRGNPVVDGLGMLLHQAVPGFTCWFGVRPEVDRELRDFVLKGLG